MRKLILSIFLFLISTQTSNSAGLDSGFSPDFYITCKGQIKIDIDTARTSIEEVKPFNDEFKITFDMKSPKKEANKEIIDPQSYGFNVVLTNTSHWWSRIDFVSTIDDIRKSLDPSRESRVAKKLFELVGYKLELKKFRLDIEDFVLSYDLEYIDKNTGKEVSVNSQLSLISGIYNLKGEAKTKIMRVKYNAIADCSVNDELVKFLDKNQSNKSNKLGSSGTAFFINAKGYLLTNNHVVEGCELQQVKYNDKDYEAKIVATDKTLDLALMKIEAKPKNYLKFSESSLEKLQKVYVAGYPFGKGLSDDLKISSGIVSSVKGFDDNSNEFQLDAAINPGNSGGPIVDDTGELIGIAVAGLAKDKSEGINFGIKSLSAVAFLKTNNIDPETSIMTFGMNNKKLLQLLEESTVYTYCN
jgi:S1-C subfamily serine protease